AAGAGTRPTGGGSNCSLHMLNNRRTSRRILVLKNLPGGEDDYFQLLALLLKVTRRTVEGLENTFRHGWR
ncbi:unnamed protein product, partial [Amoebophrya sp. A25]